MLNKIIHLMDDYEQSKDLKQQQKHKYVPSVTMFDRSNASSMQNSTAN